MVGWMLLIFFVSMFIGVPIALSLGLAAGVLLIFVSGLPNLITAQMMYTAADSFNLMAIPFFILAGNLMGHGGLSKRLIDFANMLIGGFSGGLGVIAIATSMFFAAISGSGGAGWSAIPTANMDRRIRRTISDSRSFPSLPSA